MSKNSGQFIIENYEDNNKWWIAPWNGDPGRTLKKENAKRYLTMAGANRAISQYLNRYSFRKMNLRVVNMAEF